MSLKIILPAVLLLSLFSCAGEKPEAPKDTMQIIDGDYIKGLQSLKTNPPQCAGSSKATSKIEISTEGKVPDGMLMCIFMDEVAGRREYTGCMQLIYLGPFQTDITTDPFYNDEKAQYYYNVRLIDTTKWVEYSWAPDVSIAAKKEMEMHLRYSADKSNDIKFE